MKEKKKYAHSNDEERKSFITKDTHTHTLRYGVEATSS